MNFKNIKSTIERIGPVGGLALLLPISLAQAGIPCPMPSVGYSADIYVQGKLACHEYYLPPTVRKNCGNRGFILNHQTHYFVMIDDARKLFWNINYDSFDDTPLGYVDGFLCDEISYKESAGEKIRQYNIERDWVDGVLYTGSATINNEGILMKETIFCRIRYSSTNILTTETTVEVKNIERKTPSSGWFQVPADYKNGLNASRAPERNPSRDPCPTC